LSQRGLKWEMKELAKRLGGEWFGDPSVTITGFATDSQKVLPGSLFLAIRGNRVDGHDFVGEALAKGAVATVAERPVSGPYVLVPNLVQSLARMAASYRESFDGPVVGITGSAGKTTTKEFVAAALGELGPVLKSAGNRNTEYTSPLIWAELEPRHRSAVIEMAMRGFGQIAHLASFSQPTLGMITNIGYAHLEQVGSREGIAKAKTELYDGLPEIGLCVYGAEDDFAEYLGNYSKRTAFTFGFGPRAACQIRHYRPKDLGNSEIQGVVDGIPWYGTLPGVGRHVALDAAAAILVAHLLGIEPQVAMDRLSTAELPPMRMEVLKVHGVRILLDAYNASPPSMAAAIETVMELPGHGNRHAILGEMRELGDYAESAHRALGELIAKSGLESVALIGKPTAWTRESAERMGMKPQAIVSLEDVLAARGYLETIPMGDTVLIKGSRALELERVLK
jgi:UDP-N-acetylmuramoyl-tripeptide--D-alanyl-D-alanine ligase